MKTDITNPNACKVVRVDIPVEEILERLPGESLIRFKSVSKQWKLMIESSYFAKRCLDRLPHPKLLILQSETSIDKSSRTLFLETFSKDHNHHNKRFLCSYKFPDPHSEFYFHQVGRIMGHCNGLVCIYHFGCIYLINPMTRILKTLSSSFLQNCTGRPSWSGKLPITVGFGRDIVTGTYKVILMYIFDRIDANTFVKTEVFNLSSGERRCICCPIRNDQLNKNKTSIFANGSLFWLTFRKLAALDLHTEQFRYVLLPSWYTNYSESVNLWSLNDRLCLSDVLQYPTVDVWSLQQEDPSVKWEKMLSVDISSMDCLDSNFWKLGLAACSLRPLREKPSSPLEQIPLDHFSTVLYTENLESIGFNNFMIIAVC